MRVDYQIFFNSHPPRFCNKIAPMPSLHCKQIQTGLKITTQVSVFDRLCADLFSDPSRNRNPCLGHTVQSK